MGTRRTLKPPSPSPKESSKYYFSKAFEDYYNFRWKHTVSISSIESYSKHLLKGNNLTISRFNDSEWAFALNIKEWTNRIIDLRNQGYEKELFQTGSKLLKIINSNPEYKISIDKSSFVHPLFKDKIQPYVDNLNFIGSGVFNVWALYTGFKDLFKVFNRRKTIVVGPEMLSELPFKFKHYKTPLKGVNYDYKKYTKEIEEYINTIWEPNMVIIYSCSFLAKISLDNLYKKYGNSITQLDMGASLNPFVRYSNRPWHPSIIKYIKDKDDPVVSLPYMLEKTQIINNGHTGHLRIEKMIGKNVEIHPLAYIENGVTIGDNTKIGPFCIVRTGATIGKNCKFTAYCEIRENVVIGDNTTMGSRCTISANATIGSNTTIKYGFVLTDTPDLKEGDKKVVKGVGNNVLIGANVTLMPGFSIGNNSIIGACSQVRAHVGENEIWYGSPAKFYKDNE